MSITTKAIIALGFAEGVAGVFTAAVTGDPSPAVAGSMLGALTITAGITMEAIESAKPVAQEITPPNKLNL